ncbi:redox-sensitive transcriptional activator SoxR [Sphingomonas sp. HF-S4]|uniref:Redox-sensitive transcriptional activator SoxR n=1 Tax=Sphingomonas agrestis TaxID=3080540 RepID=A0ABU3Y6E6_9SPHN|nr:redox-sensitive transcriptional activator SoxR [Sphingomonas sp. HF-S4]MDV3456976.1 redox-sensitive transcriptional activator SoxR [Sphingomonas sp. HF-S4]
MNRGNELLTIGELAARTGLSVSAVRFYEAKGLVHPIRTAGNQRRFLRADIRRVSFALIAQQLGFTLPQIAAELARLPEGRAPSAADWKRISQGFRDVIETRVAQLQRTLDDLDGCIGCGCLSLRKCALYNADDRAAANGAGPRFILVSRKVALGLD